VTVFANGIPSVSAAFPDIDVQEPLGTSTDDGGSHAFLTAVGSPLSVVFTIKNSGGSSLEGLTITKGGANSSDFTVTTNPVAPVPPDGSRTFTIRFAPTTTGTRYAAIHIENNVPGKNPYDVNFAGRSLSFTEDTDGDGLNDGSEYLMRALGFDWQAIQPALVNTYYANANGAGLYTPAQVQSLNVGVPLIQRNTTTGVFTLTIGVKKATNLSSPFSELPMNGPGTSTVINAQGKLEFGFTVPDNTAFFRLESQ
jgi:hypothetical protein